MHDDIYLWNKRFITDKEVDEYFKKHGLSGEQKINKKRVNAENFCVCAVVFVVMTAVIWGVCSFKRAKSSKSDKQIKQYEQVQMQIKNDNFAHIGR